MLGEHVLDGFYDDWSLTAPLSCMFSCRGIETSPLLPPLSLLPLYVWYSAMFFHSFPSQLQCLVNEVLSLQTAFLRSHASL